MTSASRTAQFAKVHKVLKKYYKPVIPPAERPVLEHLLFACCLEDARYEMAEEAFAALQHTFFDWNEVRVTSLSELSEVMSALPDSRVAANRVKRVLHAIFEQLYSFDLEEKRKKTLGPTVDWLTALDGVTKFSVAYVVQSALGGHSIPVDCGTMSALRVLDLVADKDVTEGVVPGLERAVAKPKAVEFGSLLHQLGADFTANPYSPQLREILLQIEPTAAERFPQRRVARGTESPARDRRPRGEERESAEPPSAEESPSRERRPRAEDSEAGERQTRTGTTERGRGRKKKPEGQPDREAPATGGDPKRAAEGKTAEGKKAPPQPPGKKASHESAGPVADEKKSARADEDGKEKSGTEGLAKRKPR